MSNYSDSLSHGAEVRRFVLEDPSSAAYPSVEISTAWDIHGWVQVSCIGGEAKAKLDQKTGHFTIARLDVENDYRRNGIGKRLLIATEREGRRRGATYFTAKIISKECLLAMREVFGPEEIATFVEGTFEGEEPYIETEAYLAYCPEKPEKG